MWEARQRHRLHPSFLDEFERMLPPDDSGRKQADKPPSDIGLFLFIRALRGIFLSAIIVGFGPLGEYGFVFAHAIALTNDIRIFPIAVHAGALHAWEVLTGPRRGSKGRK
jgi:hypothetical protein